MHIQVQDYVSRGDAALRTHTERRVEASLTRCMNRVRRVIIEFSDADGGCQSVFRCLVRVETRCGRAVAIDDTRACMHAALDKALHTAKRMVTAALADRRTTEGARR